MGLMPKAREPKPPVQEITKAASDSTMKPKRSSSLTCTINVRTGTRDKWRGPPSEKEAKSDSYTHELDLETPNEAAQYESMRIASEQCRIPADPIVAYIGDATQQAFVMNSAMNSAKRKRSEAEEEDI